jgi:LysM repeat protein
MKTRPVFQIITLFALTAALALLSVRAAKAQEPLPGGETSPTPSEPQFTPWDIINSINNLRASFYGLPPLNAHPALMEIAQIEANGIAAGYPGHWRPNNMTLGQWMLSKGFPLSGDLSMDGYRSENWFSASLSTTQEDVMNFWQGDAEHSDTMFSEFRSDIGAALALGEDGYIYVVIETALQTQSGQMQYEARAILTGIPQTQAAYAQMSTQAAASGLLPQNSVPVFVSTARPDGDVYHEVQYGQSLWSIAISYNTTIKEIQRLNNLYTIDIQVGDRLLIRKGATQPAPLTTAMPSATPRPSLPPMRWQSPTPARQGPAAPETESSITLSLVSIGAAALVLGVVLTQVTRTKK